ncbi:hypothetical protein M9458_057697, partial [Cirrhinus mrigala]
MSLKNFWPQSFDNMGRTRGIKDKKDVPTEPDGDTQDGDQAESPAVDGLDPALAKALSVMTSNIIKVIDDKLSPLVETIHKNTTEIQAASKRLDEAEARLLAVEGSAETQEPRIVELEKQVSALTESLDMAENYSRRLNIRVVGLPEDTETGQPVEFFESWLPSVLKITTKAGRIKLERAHRTLAPKPEPQGVIKRRKAYDAVKQRLRERGMPYAMLFPATLQVTHGSSKKRFSTPEEYGARSFVCPLWDSPSVIAVASLLLLVGLDHPEHHEHFLTDKQRALSRRWRFQPYLLKDDKFISYFTSEFKIFYSINSSSTDNPSVLWETCKLYSRGLIMSFVASKRRRKNEQRKLLESQLAELEKNHTSSPSPDLLKELLSARAALNTFLIQDSEQEANISLILKKGKCPESCASYRPIALLNSDQKLLSKILASRLEKVLPHIVKEDQTGFIKGRTSCDNLRRLLNIIQLTQSRQDPALVLSLDAEKAFDRVEWSYLFFALEEFGLGDNFVNWIKVLYNTPTAAVLTNGLRSDNFPLHRGNRQGDPLSPLLFDIAIEPLAQAVRQNKLISGIFVGEREHKITLYADDILILLSKPETSVPCLIKVISSFSVFSGYKINFAKSEAMPLGSLTCVPDRTEPFPFRWSPAGFIYLGVHVTPTFGQMFESNFPPLLEAIRADLDRWAALPLSWLGRVALIKMNVLPRLLYPLQMIPILLSNRVIKVLEGWLSSFIWSKRRPRLKMTKLQMAGCDGGLDVPNLRFYQLASHLRVISSWLNRDPASIWHDIESSQAKSIRSIESRAQLTSPLTPIPDNPDFLPGCEDQGFKV